jgi:isoleucyl-tRNA synthetase
MIGGYDFNKIETEILDFWIKTEIYKKAKEKNKGKQKFTYLDGPPYTSGRIHIGHAWGKALRDSIMRFKRMKGFDVWDRAGFDMHGLPTENKVAALHNLEKKEQIEEFGIERFQKECEKFCVENMNLMIEDFKRMGIWMDFDNPYMPVTPEYIEGEWMLAKIAFDKGKLYEGAKVMTWCPKCETSLSKHELEYKQMNDYSIYVKFKLEGKENEYLIIWTTTPWTIPFNLAVMVHPDFEYVKIDVDGEHLIVAKELVENFMDNVVKKQYKIIKEFKGKELNGKRYVHVFHNESDLYEEILKNNKRAFTVILNSDYVDLSAGTGLVHCAPGCGPEDYEAAKPYELPAFNETNESGQFSENMKKFYGLTAKKDDHIFIEALKNNNSLVAKQKISHDYPTCWRCKNPIIFRPTKQWFFKTEDLKERMIEINKTVKWVPDSAFNAFNSWLENIKDNGITRQRYWGTPVPIWKCESKSCNHNIVIGSIKELQEKSGKLPENFHIPWIDKITIPCEKCGKEMHRIPDIFDVWIDSGSAAWNCYDYPQKNKDFEKYFPADLILEGKDQIRGWFNLLMVASTIAFDKAPFKAVYMHGFINDYRGMKMSKSLGNVTSPYEIIENFGADVLRYYTIGSANPGCDMNYNPEEPKARLRNLLILWNLHKFLIDTIEVTKIKPNSINLNDYNQILGLEEKYILSRLHSTNKKITETFESYKLNETSDIIESFYLDLSRSYIQFIRDKLTIGSEDEKKVIVKVFSMCLMDILKISAPIIPFICEKMYQNIKEYIGEKEESIHLFNWPEYDSLYIDDKLEEEFLIADKVIQSSLHCREKMKQGVRWPLKELIVETKEHKIRDAINNLKDLIKQQINVKDIIVIEHFDKAHIKYKADYKQLGKVCGPDTQKVYDLIADMQGEKINLEFRNNEILKLKVDDKEYLIKPEYLVKEILPPKEHVSEEIKNGILYLNGEITKELESEGYAREVMRRIQNARKEAGLKKNDLIKIYIFTHSESLINMLKNEKETIADKVGANELEFLKQEPTESFTDNYEDEIKGKKFKILFNR